MTTAKLSIFNNNFISAIAMNKVCAEHSAHYGWKDVAKGEKHAQKNLNMYLLKKYREKYKLKTKKWSDAQR